jgi:NodT family efflux transporter outer membrane factor (OMF) lipoprotein
MVPSRKIQVRPMAYRDPKHPQPALHSGSSTPRLICLGAISALVLGGCRVGPEYSKPDATVNSEWLESAVAPPSGPKPDNARWWESFDDPVLNKLITEAYQQNLNLRTAGLRVLEARARRGVAVGEFYPQLQEVFGDISNNQQSANAPATGDQSFAQASVGLQAAWELDFWGKFRRGIEAADAELLASVANYDAVLVSLVAEVATSYILIRATEERLEVTRTNVALQQNTLELTRVRFKAGAVSELDVSTARATLADTQAAIPRLEDSLRQAKLALCVLLGKAPSTLDVELAPTEGQSRIVPEAPPQIALGVPAELLRRRPDVRQAERVAAAQSARIGVATADLYPSISIAGATGFASSNYEGLRTPDLGNIFDADSFTGFIGLQVNWPILQYGRVTGNIRAQDALFEQAVAQYQNSVLKAAAEVEGGLYTFLRARDQAGYLGESVAAAQRSVELSLIQYRNGAVDFIRVNDAQTVLVTGQDRFIVAKAAISLGAVQTFRALGGGWEIRIGNEFIDETTSARMRKRTDWGDVMGPPATWEKGKDLGFPRPLEESPDAAEQPR